MNLNHQDDLEYQNIELSFQNSPHQRPSHSRPSATVWAATTPPIPEKPQNDETAKRGILHAILHPSWHTMFIIACAIAVSLDPLFFYIPIINEDRKCLHVDSTLKTTALVLRSVMDLTFVLHIVYQIYEAVKKVDRVYRSRNTGNKLKYWEDGFLDWFERAHNVVHELEWRSFITDIFCLLPIPQVLLVVVFFRMKGNGYLDQRKVLSFFLLIQYVARIYRIFLSSQKFSKSAGIWVKGIFNFFLYIIGSHVIGAFWYFFAIQRETSCWHRTCGRDCASTFYCDQDDPLSPLINDVINRINSTCHWSGTFDYGIFKKALESHNTESTTFMQKLCYCFWWGLRNLSNFGTNLDSTSNYPWENLFGVLVSISGLLIFLYLIGNVQTYMQMQTSKSEEIRVKIKTKGKLIKAWMTRNNVPPNLKEDIITNIKQKLEENKDADLENLFDILPWRTRKALKRHLCMDALLRVPMLRRMDEKVVKMICDYMKPVMYPTNHVFVEAGDRVSHMILITEGALWITGSRGGSQRGGPSPVRSLERGSFYGEQQLLGWAAPKSPPNNHHGLTLDHLPTANETAKCHTKVEGFTLSATDLKTIVHKCKYLWKYNR